MINTKLFWCILFTLILSSCLFQESKKLPSYTLTPRNFENMITIGGFVEPVNSTTIDCPRRMGDLTVIYLVEDGTYVEEGDTLCKLEHPELGNEYDQMLVTLENIEAGLNKIKAELHLQQVLMEAQVKNNEAQAKIAALDSLQLIYASPKQRRVKELELEKVLIERAKIQKKLEALEIINQSEIRRQEIEVQQYKNRVKSMEEELARLIILSPKKGLAMRPIYRITGTKLNVGDPVWGGMPLVTIPDIDEMKVMIMAPEQEYKYINVDDSVYYTFDAMPGNHGWGKITKKSPVGQPYKHDSKVKYFEIEASVDSCLVLPEPGFTAKCYVMLQQVKDTLVVPQIAVFREDSLKVVFVEKSNGYEMREVETGLSSPKEAIIIAGLNEQETIALARPRESQIKKRSFLENGVAETDSVKINSVETDLIETDSVKVE